MKKVLNLNKKIRKLFILLLIFFILSSIGLAVVLMKETFTSTKKKLLEIYKPEVIIEHDYSSINGESLDLLYKSLDKIEKSQYVKTLEIETTIQLETFYLKQYSPLSNNNNSMEKKSSAEDIAVFKLSDKEVSDKEIIDGHNINKQNENSDKEVIITEQLAYANKIGIGDKIIFTPFIDQENKIYLEIEFIVVGISKKTPLDIKDNNGNVVESFDPYANTIYTSKAVIEETDIIISKENKKKQNIESYVTFYLNQFEDIENFELENKSFLPIDYKFKNNYETYSNVKKPIKKIEAVINCIMVATFAVSISIIVLLVISILKTCMNDRKYIAILHTAASIIVISTIAILISLYPGEKVCENVSEKLIEYIVKEEMKDDNIKTSISIFGNNESKITVDDFINLYTVNLNKTLLLKIYIVNTGCIFLATLISIIYILMRKKTMIE
ncbi:hypothetical protein [Candidatus Galacturonibacter soehngenii]|uniref:MacB-like periplasmic core domain-containing protein n=1 Tax=Candidatus Galacturonatibacter soehngenii TaxID=2307010 RepID=A0A7V7UAW3_9FIRM|nr:hypothetical protein [Candidatus Galacturonibacter soehngenii]KAB1435858.1 hypothetical protein F7O84_15895 [Candidatus Galacturonibacter soehngenii]MBA4686601.1 hypothetical protein [Candidatus Galacturonibacter soehngenii]